MSGCALRRWGPGTACTKEPDTVAANETAAALARMRAEREKQDAMWLLPPQEEPPPTKSIKPENPPKK
jgi:hypothetical protein